MLRSARVVVAFCMIGVLAGCCQEKQTQKSSSQPPTPPSLGFSIEVEGACKDAVSFSDWVLDNNYSARGTMEYHGGTIGEITFKAYGSGGVIVEEDGVIVKAELLSKGDRCLVKIISPVMESFARVVIRCPCTPEPMGWKTSR